MVNVFGPTRAKWVILGDLRPVAGHVRGNAPSPAVVKGLDLLQLAAGEVAVEPQSQTNAPTFVPVLVN